jgi:CheY-like chemotaxis protein
MWDGRRADIRRTILVVDTEPIVQKTMSAILERMGYRVVVAMDGQRAGELFSRNAPELVLVIVEISLPRVSGPEFVESLPTLAPRIPVLFTTGMGDYEVPDDIRWKFPVLQKPFRAATLVADVKTLISSI